MLIKLTRHLPIHQGISQYIRASPNTVLPFSNIIFRKGKKNLEKTRADTNSRLKNFHRQKNINVISNDNIKEENLGIKKLHLNREGNSTFAKNLLNFIEGNWDISPLGDSYYETENASNTIIQMLNVLLGIFVLIDWFLDI